MPLWVRHRELSCNNVPAPALMVMSPPETTAAAEKLTVDSSRIPVSSYVLSEVSTALGRLSAQSTPISLLLGRRRKQCRGGCRCGCLKNIGCRAALRPGSDGRAGDAHRIGTLGSPLALEAGPCASSWLRPFCRCPVVDQSSQMSTFSVVHYNDSFCGVTLCYHVS
jgi:hypothetical protein